MSVLAKDRVVDLELHIHASTERTIKVSLHDEPAAGVWLPKSQIESEPIGKNLFTVTLPEWLAIEKGLV